MKGCDLLIEAFAKIAENQSGVHLVVGGPDHEAWVPELKARAAGLGISGQITWAGFLSPEMKWSALRAANLFILPSRCETFPMGVIEALGCGLPVLITEEVNIWTTVAQAGAGFVCSAQADAVRQSMAQWLALEEGEAHQYRERARRCFLANYELRSAFKTHVDALRGLMPLEVSLKHRP